MVVGKYKWALFCNFIHCNLEPQLPVWHRYVLVKKTHDAINGSTIFNSDNQEENLNITHGMLQGTTSMLMQSSQAYKSKDSQVNQHAYM